MSGSFTGPKYESVAVKLLLQAKEPKALPPPSKC